MSTKSEDVEDHGDEVYEESGDEQPDPESLPAYNIDRTEMLNWLVQRIVEKIPKQQLLSLRWYHRLPITMRTILVVCDNHSQALREFKVRHYQKTQREDEISEAPMALSSIEVRSIGMGSDRSTDNPVWLKSLIKDNKKSLHELRIGQESYIHLLEQGWTDSRSRRVALDHVLLLAKTSTGTFSPYELTCLEVVGLKVDCLVDEDPTRGPKPLLRWSILQRLVLESCPGSRDLLSCLAENISRAGQTKLHLTLKELVFRYERPSTDLMAALETFLKTYSGLRLISVLVDEYGLFPSGPMLANHLSSLNVLVWEARMMPRNARNLEVSPPKAEEDIVKTFKKCPNLVEISFPLDWRRHQRGGLGSLDRLGRDLASLRELRTIHIRNVPLLRGDEDDDVDGYEDNIEMDRISRSIVTEVTEAMVEQQNETKEVPSADLIVVGPLRYQERWLSTKPWYTNANYPPAYARPYFFGVDYAYSAKFDARFPLLKELGHETLAVAEPYSSHLRCFESYWLV